MAMLNNQMVNVIAVNDAAVWPTEKSCIAEVLSAGHDCLAMSRGTAEMDATWRTRSSKHFDFTLW